MIKTRLDDLRQQEWQDHRDDRKGAAPRNSPQRGIEAPCRRAPEAALFRLAQDGAQIDRLRAIVRYLRLPRRRPKASRTVIACIGVVHTKWPTVPGPIQGLYFDAEAERLSLDPYDRRRSRPSARRAADPHARDAGHRRVTASPRMRSIRTAVATDREDADARRAAPINGCGGRSKCWPKATRPRNFSSIPSSNCFTTRCSASLPKAG